MSTTTPQPTGVHSIENTRWRIDPTRSRIEFRTPTFWGLITVKGRFERYDGTLDLRHEPAVELTIDASSLDTNNHKRDKHLRSADFFDVDNHPQVRFVSDSATLDGERLTVSGRLYAAGTSTPLTSTPGCDGLTASWKLKPPRTPITIDARHEPRPTRHDPHPE